MNKPKELIRLSKELKSLDKKSDKTFDAYEKVALKCRCYTCKTRGNPVKVPFEKLHDNCVTCQYAKSVLPLFIEDLKARKAVKDFIEKEYFPAAYKFLAETNPYIEGPKGAKGPFLKVFSTPASRMDYQTKEVIVYTLEGGSLYDIINK